MAPEFDMGIITELLCLMASTGWCIGNSKSVQLLMLLTNSCGLLQAYVCNDTPKW
jgi:hypothetical protein